MKTNRKAFFGSSLTAAVVWILVSGAALAADPAADPLPSWNDGPTKQAILSFVKETTDKSSAKYIVPEDRIATFDNDGTLWCEQPVVELVFTEERLKELAAKDPTLMEKQPFKAALEGDREYFEKAGMKAVLELVVATHGNMSQAQFETEARDFFKTAKQPKFGVPFAQTAFLPMVELLQYLRANGFQTWICSGGWMDLMRMVTQEAYGIPSQQVIGSSLKEEWVEKDGKYVLWLLPELLSICDHAGKPVNIDLHIGKRPVLAAGNVRTGGDIEMLRYCQGRKGPTLQLMVNHDDAVREFAYGEKNHESLDAAKKNGWTVVSMKDNWKRVFAFEQ
jgi:phosphoglycolate phosphatase-like HAD superfamily hydrolase